MRIVAETEDTPSSTNRLSCSSIQRNRTGRVLWQELRQLFAFEIENGGQISIVNRLDRETSGLILVGKTSAAARRFGLLMQDHRIKKEYHALIWGWPEWETQLVDAPLDRLGKYRRSTVWLKQAVIAEGAAAQTEFFVERRFVSANSEKFSLVRAIPLTGRTHQIRVHLAETGHPIVGDKIYGPDERLYLEFIETGWTPSLQTKLLLPRHALHSSRLEVEGVGGWTSELPPDLLAFINSN